MEAIVSIIAGAPSKFRRDDDAIDRFHHRYTTILLAAFAVVSTTHQLVGEPIACWAPKEFEDSWIKYTNTYCWVRNTYFLPFEEDIPKEHEEKDEIVYYQWIPFVFIGMAIFFYLPSLVWTSFNSKAGVDSDNILETAETFRKTDKLVSKEKHLKLITNQIDRFVGSTPRTVGGMMVDRKVSKSIFCLCGRKFGNYLVLLYVFTKCLYIVNILGQLFALNEVLETDFNIFGVSAIQNMMDDKAFLNHTIFPKVTMCDFNIRALGNVRRYTVQCLLPINLYTEKMFVFLWFWMVFVLIITIISLTTWLVQMVLPRNRYGFIENALFVMDRMERKNKSDEANCEIFVSHYLRLDGVFVLRMIGHNTNKITSSEIIASIWDNWLEKTQSCRGLDEPDFSNVDTMPLKPMPPPKPVGFRPQVSPPQPPMKSPYPAYGGAKNYPEPTSPTAPMNEYTCTG